MLGFAWSETQIAIEADFSGNRGVDQLIESFKADRGHHFLYIRGRGTDVPRYERLSHWKSSVGVLDCRCHGAVNLTCDERPAYLADLAADARSASIWSGKHGARCGAYGSS